jgi:hypothetical protein
MTVASLSQPRAHSRPRSVVTTIAITIVASSAVLGLLLSGVTFLAVGVSFAFVVPIAQHYAVSFSAADLALAGRVAELWWVFAALSAASYLGAALVAVKAIHHLDPAPRG